MNKTLILLACFILIGSLTAQTFLAGNYNGHSIYLSDTLIALTNGNYTMFVAGTYHTMFDRSKGPITVFWDNNNIRGSINTLRHEICHAKQDDEHRPQNEDECYGK